MIILEAQAGPCSLLLKGSVGACLGVKQDELPSDRHCPHDPGASLHLWFLSWVVSDPPQILAASIKIWQRAEGYKLRLVIPQVHRHLELA